MKLSPHRFRPDATNFNTFPTVPTYPFTLWSDAVGIFVSMKIWPTQEQLKSFFHYEPETGLFYRLPSYDLACNLNKRGYRRINHRGEEYKAHTLAWIYMHGSKPADLEVDHIDRNPSNNRIDNLRLATKSQNAWNQCKPSNNSSGYKGVSFDKKSNRWRARLSCHNKNHLVGYFDCPKEADAAIRKFREKLHADFANHV